LLAAFGRYRAVTGDGSNAYGLICSTIMNLDEAVTSQ
jgi:hypothetical protein